jgi:hypothetical protein
MEDNIKTDVREIGWGCMGFIDLAQDKGSCEHSNELPGSIKRWKILE